MDTDIVVANMKPGPVIGGDYLLSVALRFRGVPGFNQADNLAVLGPKWQYYLENYEINTPLRIAHFTAQMAYESVGFSRLLEPESQGRNYEGREDLGNDQPGDGVRFRGRGIIQLTGRDNYRRYGPRIGCDLEESPERAAEPSFALMIACLYWQDKGLNALADADDINGITRRINGGLNGIKDRRIYLDRAKRALPRDYTPAPKPLTKSRTMAGAGIAGAATVASAAVEALRSSIDEAQEAVQPLTSVSDYAHWAFIALGLIGAGVVVYARFDDWRRAVK